MADDKTPEGTAPAKPEGDQLVTLTPELRASITKDAVTQYQEENGPPKEYDFKEVKDAEGKPLPEDFVKTVATIARESGLSQKQAAALAPFVSREVQSRLTAIATENQPETGSAWKARVEGWEKEAIADPALGGGSRDRLLVQAELGRRVLQHFGDDAKPLAEFLDQTGFGSHPAVLRMLAAVGRTMKEADFVRPSDSTTKKESGRLEDRLFPKTAKKE